MVVVRAIVIILAISCWVSETYERYGIRLARNQGRIHCRTVTNGWAGAILQNPLAIQRCNGRMDGLMDGRTDQHIKVLSSVRDWKFCKFDRWFKIIENYLVSLHDSFAQSGWPPIWWHLWVFFCSLPTSFCSLSTTQTSLCLRAVTIHIKSRVSAACCFVLDQRNVCQ